MDVTSVLPLQATGLREMMLLMMFFMAVLMSATIATAVLFDTYRGRSSMPGHDAGASRSISSAPIDTGGGGPPESARAVLEVSRTASDTQGVFSREGVAGGSETERRRVRRPLGTVSDVEPWKFAVSFVVTAGLGVVVYALGDLSLGSELVLVLALLAAFFLGAVLLGAGFKSLKMYHAVREKPTTDAADISEEDVGEAVEVYGKATVTDNGTHEAPFSDDDCVVCEYEIVEKPGKDEVADSGTAAVPFYIDDGTGRVLVDPHEASLKVALDTEVEVESREPPPEIMGGYVDVGLNEVESEYRERYLKPGEDVYVYGDALAHNEEGVVISRRDDDSLFLISDSSEGELLKSLLPEAATRGAIGIVLMSVGMGFVFWLSGVSIPMIL